MATFVMRVWLPDRPGALGQVASRIGAVRGDVVGIDILERDGGQAVDELVVELQDDQLVDLLVAEVRQVDGVAVEEVRPVADAMHDPRLDALEAAAQLVGADTVDELLAAAVHQARRVVGAAWVAVVSLDADPHADRPAAPGAGAGTGTGAGDGSSSVTWRPAGRSPVLVADPDAPSRQWLEAFLHGSRTAEGMRGRPSSRPSDVAWAPLPCSGLALVLGRNGMAYRSRERRQLAALARVVDTRMREVEDAEPEPARRQAQWRARSTARRQLA